MKTDCILITWAQDGDEIGFKLVDFKHRKRIHDEIDSANHDGSTDKLINFIDLVALFGSWVRTCTWKIWFPLDYNIMEIIYVPDF